MRKILIYSDIDGTIVDSSLEYTYSLPAIRKIKEKGDILVLASAKPASAIRNWQRKLSLNTPFICENGGAIVIPENNRELVSFSLQELSDKKLHLRKITEGLLIRLGVNRSIGEEKIRKVMHFLQAKYQIQNSFLVFPDKASSPQEIEEIKTYFPNWNEKQIRENALVPKYFDVAFQFKKDIFLTDSTKKEFFELLAKEGMNIQKGTLFFHILIKTDKGKATSFLTLLLNKFFQGKLQTVGIGDDENDLPMLLNVDYPFNIQNREGKNVLSNYQRITLIPLKGPRGFAQAVFSFYQREPIKKS